MPYAELERLQNSPDPAARFAAGYYQKKQRLLRLDYEKQLKDATSLEDTVDARKCYLNGMRNLKEQMLTDVELSFTYTTRTH